MKIKKLKKLSIFTILLALTTTISTLPGMARGFDALVTPGSNGTDQNLNINVSSYVEIEKAEGSTTNAVVSIASPTSLTISTPIVLSYNVNSNVPGIISVSATAPVRDGDGTVNALYGTEANAMTIIFTKSNSIATSSAVTNASSSSAVASSNLNAVAFTFTPQTPTATIGNVPTISVEDNTLLYSFGAGRYNLPFKVEGSSLTGTYSLDDALGEYKATLIVSKVDGE